MISLLKYLRNYKKESILSPLFKLLEASFELLVPIVMARIIDVGIADGDRPYVIRMALILVSLGLIGMACSVTAQYFAAKAAVGFSTEMKHALYGHIQGLSFKELDNLGTSSLITKMTSDANQVQSGVNMTLRLFLRSPFIVIGAMVMAFTIDERSSLVFLITIVLLSLVVFFLMSHSIPLFKKVQLRLDKLLKITRENLNGVRVVRTFNKQEDEIKDYEEANDLLTRIQLYAGKISALMNPVTYVIINIATVVLIYVGAVRVDAGSLTQGEVVALVNYMSQILVELIKLANLIITITKALACANRIKGIFEVESSMQFIENPAMDGKDSEYAVEFINAAIRYNDKGDEALTNINLSVKHGETIGIIGGTGSGKSSLINLIPRYYDVTSGSVKVDGIDVKEYDAKALRYKIGMVMQKNVLFKGTIRDNVVLGTDGVTEADIEKAVELSQSGEFVDIKEGRLDYKIEQSGRNLSGGQKQRLTIARALVRKPEILILDDSSSALDYATDARLRSAIKELDNKITVFIVSQRISSIMHADRIIVMDDGRIAGTGTHEELLNSCEIYREINSSQNNR